MNRYSTKESNIHKFQFRIIAITITVKSRGSQEDIADKNNSKLTMKYSHVLKCNIYEAKC